MLFEKDGETPLNKQGSQSPKDDNFKALRENRCKNNASIVVTDVRVMSLSFIDRNNDSQLKT